MRNFTKKEMEILKKYESDLDSAANYSFKHYTSNEENNTIAAIYEAAGGTVSRNWSCGHCIMQLYKAAGTLYFKTKNNDIKKGEK